MSKQVITLTEDTSPATNTLFYGVIDPEGTPLDRKISLSTVSASVTGVANTFTKLQTVTIPDNGNTAGMTVNQNDVTNNPSAIVITNTGTGSDITAPSFSLKSGVLTATGLALGANNITMTGSLATTGDRVTKGWFTDVESSNVPTINGTSINTAGTLSNVLYDNTGKAGGQTLIGGTLTTENLTVRANSADLTTGQVNLITTLEASNTTTGALAVAGGLAVAKRVYALDMTVTNTITGSISGNAGTVSTIAGLAPNTATTASAQPNITSVGTLTTLTVDDITINGNGITSSGASSLTIAPTAGQKIVIDGHIGIDANTITGESDNNTTITAYAGKNITIESVTFDGGDVGSVGNLGVTGTRVTKGWFTDIESTNTPTIGGVSLSTIYAPKLFEHIIQAATDTLTAAEVSGTVISNYGQEAANTQTLPDAAAGYNGMIVIGTAGAGAFHLKAGASDKIYLDGVALDDGDKASLATPAVGNYFTYWSFQTGAGAYDWIVITGQGTLTDGGA